MTARQYTRQLVLRTNAHPSVYSFTLTVNTAPLPVRVLSFPYGVASILMMSCCVIGWLASVFLPGATLGGNDAGTLALAAGFGIVVGLKLAAWILIESNMRFGGKAIAIMGFMNIVPLVIIGLVFGLERIDTFVFSAILGVALFSGTIAGIANGMTIHSLWQRGFKAPFAVAVPTAVSLLGVLIGLSRGLMIWNAWFLSGLLVCGITAAAFSAHRYVQQFQAIATYRNTERRLIKP